jgi:hypothetical protein
MTAVTVLAVRAHAGAVSAPARIDPEDTVDATDGAADRAAHYGADRPGDPIALGRAALHAARNALGLSLAGERQKAEHQPCGGGETDHVGVSSIPVSRV